MKLEQEDDLVPARTVLLVLGSTIAISLVLIAWAYFTLRAREHALRPDGVNDARLGPPRRAEAIRQQMFEHPSGSETLAEKQRAQLESWGWVDKERGLVRLPIDRAIDLMVEEAR